MKLGSRARNTFACYVLRTQQCLFRLTDSPNSFPRRINRCSWICWLLASSFRITSKYVIGSLVFDRLVSISVAVDRNQDSYRDKRTLASSCTHKIDARMIIGEAIAIQMDTLESSCTATLNCSKQGFQVGNATVGQGQIV